MTRAHWIFLRAYLLVALLVVVTGLGLEALLEQRDAQGLEQREVNLLQGGFLHAERLFTSKRNSMDTRAGQRQLEASISQALELPAALHVLADFQPLGSQYLLLERGDIVLLYDDDDQAVFYRRLTDTDQVLALGPAPALSNEHAQWVVPLFYGMIALAVFIWIRPLMRDLDTLRESAQAFGRQDFSSRVKLPPRSWLAPLGDAFNSMAQRIEWLLQSHREMTHAVSHELRTPLARLRFSLEMLGSAVPADQARHSASMNGDIEELNVLIEEMLGYAELGQDKLAAQLAPLDIGAWLQDYVSYYNNHGPRLPLCLTADKPAGPVPVDKRLISRALDNLVGNAQRYARSQVEVAVQVENGLCELSVVDDGPGIPPDQRQAVLSAYVRLDSAPEESRRGFGLGLAIVKRIMDLHGGKIVIASASSGGASITLSWPLNDST